MRFTICALAVIYFLIFTFGLSREFSPRELLRLVASEKSEGTAESQDHGVLGCSWLSGSRLTKLLPRPLYHINLIICIFSGVDWVIYFFLPFMCHLGLDVACRMHTTFCLLGLFLFFFFGQSQSGIILVTLGGFGLLCLIVYLNPLSSAFSFQLLFFNCFLDTIIVLFCSIPLLPTFDMQFS